VTVAPLVVLGASEEQVPLYREATRRGIPTVGVDIRADRPARPLANEFLTISTTDHAAIAAALAGRRVAGVVSTGSDACVESWHRLSEIFGTPWRYPAAAAAVTRDKAGFHRLAGALGLPTYRWAQFADLGALARAGARFRFPLVVKPTDASGSRGVTGIEHPDQLDPALAYAARHSPTGRVIVEELVPGRNLTVNVFLLGGAVAHAVITEKLILPGARFLIGGHVAPARLDEKTERGLLEDAAALCGAFGLTDGPANFDAIVSGDGTRYFLEVGARMCGNGFPHLVTAQTGADWLAALMDLATGGRPRLRPTRSRPTRLHVLTSPLETLGRLLTVAGLPEVATLPGVEAVEIFAAPGDIVHPFTESGRKLGWLVVSADHRAALDARVEDAVRHLDLVIAPASPGRLGDDRHLAAGLAAGTG
jgi:biotin carboxylase